MMDGDTVRRWMEEQKGPLFTLLLGVWGAAVDQWADDARFEKDAVPGINYNDVWGVDDDGNALDW